MQPRTTKHSSGRAGFLFIIPGAALGGLGVGLWLEAPAPGLLTGLGGGLVVWGLIVSLARR